MLELAKETRGSERSTRPGRSAEALEIRSRRRAFGRSCGCAYLAAWCANEIVGDEPELRSGTRPGPVGCVRDDSGADRILVNVAERRLQMGLVQGERRESLLPEVPGPASPRIHQLGVVRVNGPKKSRQRVGPIGNEDQVNVVRHEAVGENRNTGRTDSLAQERLVEPVVSFPEEDHHAASAALGDVMGDARDHDASDSHHGAQGRNSLVLSVAPSFGVW
jgi:hypothetical protein